jgi:hypothetical protein
LEYVASLENRRRAQRSSEDLDGAVLTANPWHPGLPTAPDDLLDSATLALATDEALFLQGRILDSVPETYLAVLTRDGSSAQEADLPWEHPLAESVPHGVDRQLHHAHLFSLASWGAGLVYNDELSRLLEKDCGEPLPFDYPAELAAWTETMVDHREQLTSWDRHEFWRIVYAENARISLPVRMFVDWWLDVVVDQPGDAATSSQVRDQLRQREATLKGARAKLANRRARERAPAAQGDVQLTFRWRQVSRILRDIHEGLEGNAQPA